MKASTVIAGLTAGAAQVFAAPSIQLGEFTPLATRDDKFKDCDGDSLDGLLASMMYHGTEGGDKDATCASAYKSGIFPNRLEVQEADDHVNYLKVGFTDGSSKEFGKSGGDGKKGVVKWDPYRDSFSEFSGFTHSKTGRVFALYVKLRNCDGDECGFDIGSKNGDKHDRGSANSGMLLGIKATGEGKDHLEWMLPYFTNSGVEKVRMTDPTFSPTMAQLNEMEMGENMMERKIATHVIDNRNSSTDAKMQYESGRTVEKQTKVSVTSEEGTDSGFEAGVNAKMEMSFGIPVIGQGSASVETHAKYDERTMRKSIEGKEDMETVTDVTMYTIDKIVKPGKLLEATSVAIQAKMDLDYDAKLEIVFKNRKSFNVPIRGTFREADYQEFTTTYKEYDSSEVINGDVELSKRGDDEEKIEYTGAGTFCPNGRRAGDFGMSKEEFIEACGL